MGTRHTITTRSWRTFCRFCKGAYRINRGAAITYQCPSCRKEAYYVPAADRLYHKCGTDNQHCWAEIAHGTARNRPSLVDALSPEELDYVDEDLDLFTFVSRSDFEAYHGTTY